MTKAEIKLARKRFKFADEAEKKQRQREKDDLGFYEAKRSGQRISSHSVLGAKRKATCPPCPRSHVS